MGEYHKHDMKNLEKAISKRIGGRLFHGFKKVVNSMAITNCTRELDNYLDYCEKGYRKICGYNRFADFKQFDGLTYTFEFPYLPTFGDQNWVLNQYSKSLLNLS